MLSFSFLSIIQQIYAFAWLVLKGLFVLFQVTHQSSYKEGNPRLTTVPLKYLSHHLEDYTFNS